MASKSTNKISQINAIAISDTLEWVKSRTGLVLYHKAGEREFFKTRLSAYQALHCNT